MTGHGVVRARANPIDGGLTTVDVERLEVFDLHTFRVVTDNGRRDSIVDVRKESGGSISTVNLTYTYDAFDRLTREQSAVDAGSAVTRGNSDFAIEYECELVGNRTKFPLGTNGSPQCHGRLPY